jgi:hypothetical protein
LRRRGGTVALAQKDKSLAANNKARRGACPIAGCHLNDILPMIKNIVSDLRTLAERCARSSRDCKKYELARVLDELGIELMTKASELEREFDS